MSTVKVVCSGCVLLVVSLALLSCGGGSSSTANQNQNSGEGTAQRLQQGD